MAKVKLFEILDSNLLFSGNKNDKWFIIPELPLYLTDTLENEEKEYWSNILCMKTWLYQNKFWLSLIEEGYIKLYSFSVDIENISNSKIEFTFIHK